MVVNEHVKYMSNYSFDCNNFYEATKRYIQETESEISEKNAEIRDQKDMPLRALMSWNPSKLFNFMAKFNSIN